jgi:hypothetical protein
VLYARIIVLSRPPTLLKKGLKEIIGEPKEYELNLKQGFNNNVNISIPNAAEKSNNKNE